MSTQTPDRTRDATLDKTHETEHGLARAIVFDIAVAVPICVALWIGVMAFAIRGTSTSLIAAFGMAAGLGLLTAVFFGTWAGFVSKAHELEELDREAIREASARDS
jgi:hypothetical protein